MATKIEQKIIRCTVAELPDNVIGAAVLVENDKIPHAGLFVRYNGDSKLFHFDSKSVLLEELDDQEVYFFKELPYLKQGLTPAFLAHCQLVMKEAKPIFGYYYTGGVYDENGKFRSPGDMPEYMTCVGFCLNFLKYFTDGAELFVLDDWESMKIKRSEEYVEKFITQLKKKHPSLDINDFKKGMRRILPDEYFTGAFAEAIPVGKSFVDVNVGEIRNSLHRLAVA